MTKSTKYRHGTICESAKQTWMEDIWQRPSNWPLNNYGKTCMRQLSMRRIFVYKFEEWQDKDEIFDFFFDSDARISHIHGQSLRSPVCPKSVQKTRRHCISTEKCSAEVELKTKANTPLKGATSLFMRVGRTLLSLSAPTLPD